MITNMMIKKVKDDKMDEWLGIEDIEGLKENDEMFSLSLMFKRQKIEDWNIGKNNKLTKEDYKKLMSMKNPILYFVEAEDYDKEMLIWIYKNKIKRILWFYERINKLFKWIFKFFYSKLIPSFNK